MPTRKAETSPGAGERLRRLYIGWRILDRLCDAYACACELGERQAAQRIHEVALDVASHVGATSSVISGMEREKLNCRRSAEIAPVKSSQARAANPKSRTSAGDRKLGPERSSSDR
jgi:hypothetical protein